MKQCIFNLVSIVIQHLLAYVGKYVCKKIAEKRSVTTSEVTAFATIGKTWKDVNAMIDSTVENNSHL